MTPVRVFGWRSGALTTEDTKVHRGNWNYDEIRAHVFDPRFWLRLDGRDARPPQMAALVSW
jgi:hypothetical protein